MKFNCKELAEYSNGEAIIEGRLHHKRITSFSQSGFKEKWYKLRANILFYFNTTETGKTYDKKPAGAFILENAVVQYEMNSEVPFAFSVIFNDDLDKKHLFAGRTEESITQWVNFLKQASYEFWRSQLMILQSQLCRLTGKDPLLMYPRNEGSTTTTTSAATAGAAAGATWSDHNNEANHKSKKSPLPSFRSFVAPYEEKRPEKPNEARTDNLLSLSNETLVSNVDLIGSEIKNIQIDPPPTPPRRPARAHKVKANNNYNNNNNKSNNNNNSNSNNSLDMFFDREETENDLYFTKRNINVPAVP